MASFFTFAFTEPVRGACVIGGALDAEVMAFRTRILLRILGSFADARSAASQGFVACSLLW